MNVIPEILPSAGILNGAPLQVVEVIGDHMQPTLRGWWDMVLMAPTDRFLYDALYVLEDEHAGSLLVYRVQSAGKGLIRLISDNPAYGATPDDRGSTHRRAWFNRWVRGIVVCSLKVHDRDMIMRAWGGAR